MEIPAWAKSNPQPQQTQQKVGSDPGFWGAIAGAVTGLTTTFVNNSPKNRDANVQIAEANARAAEASAANSSTGMDPKVLGIVAIVAVVGIILFVTLRKS